MKCAKCDYETIYAHCECGWNQQGVPPLFKLAIYDDLPVEPDRSLVVNLYGPTGTGKTHGAWAMAKYLRWKYNLKIGIIRGQEWSNLPSAMEAYTAPKNQDVLIIDEFVSTGGSVHPELYEVLDRRIEQKKITVTTENVLPIDDRIRSRMDYGFTIDYTGLKDLRVNTEARTKIWRARAQEWKLWLSWHQEKQNQNECQALDRQEEFLRKCRAAKNRQETSE
jgi:chromosomal replication initiation ATPase DnaA